jgi:DNA-binding MarR family transcriptional regulator
MPVVEPHRRIGYLAWRLHQATSHRAEQLLAPLRLTLVQHSVLVLLTIEPNLSSAELARRTGVTAPAMSKAASELAARGLVCRRPHPSHGRVVLLRASAEGRRLAVRSQRALDAIEQDTTADLSWAEQEQFRRLLRRVVRRLAPEALPECDW